MTLIPNPFSGELGPSPIVGRECTVTNPHGRKMTASTTETVTHSHAASHAGTPFGQTMSLQRLTQKGLRATFPLLIPEGLFVLVGDTGLEPVISSVSGKRATAAPIAHSCGLLEVETGFEPV